MATSRSNSSDGRDGGEAGGAASTAGAGAIAHTFMVIIALILTTQPPHFINDLSAHPSPLLIVSLYLVFPLH